MLFQKNIIHGFTKKPTKAYILELFAGILLNLLQFPNNSAKPHEPRT